MVRGGMPRRKRALDRSAVRVSFEAHAALALAFGIVERCRARDEGTRARRAVPPLQARTAALGATHVGERMRFVVGHR